MTQQLTQRSTEWRQLRCGDITASRFKDVMAKSKNKDEQWGATNLSYLEELLYELISGKPADRSPNVSSINHGIAYEDVHRQAAFEYLQSRMDDGHELVLPEGGLAYIAHPTEPGIGCSVDWAVLPLGTSGGEMKCPEKGANHVAYLRRGLEWFMKQHKAQVQGTLWVTDWHRYYVSSYHPDFPKDQQLVLWGVERNEIYIHELRERILSFRDLLMEEYWKLTGGPF